MINLRMYLIQEHSVYLKILKRLKRHLAKGGSLDNAVVVDDEKILNDNGLEMIKNC